MDIYSSKFAIIIIIALLGILGLQVMTNSNNAQLIDAETCELYIMDPNINAKKYLDEYDQKCLDFKSLNP